MTPAPDVLRLAWRSVVIHGRSPYRFELTGVAATTPDCLETRASDIEADFRDSDHLTTGCIYGFLAHNFTRAWRLKLSAMQRSVEYEEEELIASAESEYHHLFSRRLDVTSKHFSLSVSLTQIRCYCKRHFYSSVFAVVCWIGFCRRCATDAAATARRRWILWRWQRPPLRSLRQKPLAPSNQ